MSPLFKFSEAIANENLPRVHEKGILTYKNTILIMEEKRRIQCSSAYFLCISS